MKIAVTGGLGTGKSTVSRLLAALLHSRFIDTDELCRTQMMPGRQGFLDFSALFGSTFIQSDGHLNRQLLRQAVFNDSGVKKALEGVLHPLVRKEVNDTYRLCEKSGELLVVEVPLLFETGWQVDYDVNVFVYVPQQIIFNRVSLRDGLSAREVSQVLAAQLPIAEKLAMADVIINNAGLFASTVQQTAWIAKKLHTWAKKSGTS